MGKRAAAAKAKPTFAYSNDGEPDVEIVEMDADASEWPLEAFGWGGELPRGSGHGAAQSVAGVGLTNAGGGTAATGDGTDARHNDVPLQSANKGAPRAEASTHYAASVRAGPQPQSGRVKAVGRGSISAVRAAATAAGGKAKRKTSSSSKRASGSAIGHATTTVAVAPASNSTRPRTRSPRRHGHGGVCSSNDTSCGSAALAPVAKTEPHRSSFVVTTCSEVLCSEPLGARSRKYCEAHAAIKAGRAPPAECKLAGASSSAGAHGSSASSTGSSRNASKKATPHHVRRAVTAKPTTVAGSDLGRVRERAPGTGSTGTKGRKLAISAKPTAARRRSFLDSLPAAVAAEIAGNPAAVLLCSEPACTRPSAGGAWTKCAEHTVAARSPKVKPRPQCREPGCKATPRYGGGAYCPRHSYEMVSISDGEGGAGEPDEAHA
jgi:hypothetical protein